MVGKVVLHHKFHCSEWNDEWSFYFRIPNGPIKSRTSFFFSISKKSSQLPFYYFDWLSILLFISWGKIALKSYSNKIVPLYHYCHGFGVESTILLE